MRIGYKIVVVLLFVIGTFNGMLAQSSSQTFRVEFGDSVSVDYEVTLPENIPFTGISAYCIDTNYTGVFSYRILQDSIWSNWMLLSQFEDGSLLKRLSYKGEPIDERFSEIQFRARNIPNSYAVFRLFYPGRSEKKGVEMTEVSCDCQQVSYCAHHCWCPQNDCPKDVSPTPTDATHIIIHHSAGENSSVDYAAMVALYWDLHVNTNGWDDIGYNWLVDPHGEIYEGRGAGTQGAHFSCMNSNTIGICVMGNYEDVVPTTESLESVERLIAWLACENNIDVSVSSYHTSSDLVLEQISAHRDGNSSTASNSCVKGTACPGQFLYDRLSEIRTGVSDLDCMRVGLEELISEGFVIFPNPDTGNRIVTLRVSDEMKNGEVIVCNNLGQELVRTSTELSETILDVNEFAEGIYYIQVKTQTSVRIKKMILN